MSAEEAKIRTKAVQRLITPIEINSIDYESLAQIQVESIVEQQLDNIQQAIECEISKNLGASNTRYVYKESLPTYDYSFAIEAHYATLMNEVMEKVATILRSDGFTVQLTAARDYKSLPFQPANTQRNLEVVMLIAWL